MFKLNPLKKNNTFENKILVDFFYFVTGRARKYKFIIVFAALFLYTTLDIATGIN